MYPTKRYCFAGYPADRQGCGHPQAQVAAVLRHPPAQPKQGGQQAHLRAGREEDTKGWLFSDEYTK